MKVGDRGEMIVDRMHAEPQDYLEIGDVMEYIGPDQNDNHNCLGQFIRINKPSTCKYYVLYEGEIKLGKLKRMKDVER